MILESVLNFSPGETVGSRGQLNVLRSKFLILLREFLQRKRRFLLQRPGSFELDVEHGDVVGQLLYYCAGFGLLSFELQVGAREHFQPVLVLLVQADGIFERLLLL